MSKPTGEDPESLGYGEDADYGGDGAGRVTLSEAAQATEHVVEGCRRKLQLLRSHLKGKESGLRTQTGIGGPEDVPSPHAQTLAIASELEACAGALLNASTSEE